ncbi:MAG: hypothetical protein OSB70_07475 [Myxococcota bacterium]|nr:hypothetical protein [Myxococcota bacterium]
MNRENPARNRVAVTGARPAPVTAANLSPETLEMMQAQVGIDRPADEPASTSIYLERST